jgi:riboflavin synthase
MFTGITEHVATIESIENGTRGGRLLVSLAGASEIAVEMKRGDSIAVNGCCLTVVEFNAHHFAADMSGETLRRTSLGEKKSGDLVNLERPLAATARLGGHFVQGHVDGVGRVTALVPEGVNWWLSWQRGHCHHSLYVRAYECPFDGLWRRGELGMRHPRKICRKFARRA